ncbi:nucleotidyltransferase family protein [Candidatus Poribacteria bacterium]|nr:nucleotidyltransferase family protein [Candidatus Poribacteria bacterium]
MTDILSEKTEYLASEYGVKRIGLFGSYAKGTSIEPTSDVDIVVEFDRPIGFKFMELADYLEEILGKPVDLLTENTIQAIRYPKVAESIRESIIYVQQSE